MSDYCNSCGRPHGEAETCGRRRRWKSIPQWDGLYEVSTDGRVRSVDRVIHRERRRFYPGKELKPVVNKGSRGYAMVMLRNGNTGERRLIAIHRLMALAFLQPPLAGQDRVRHLNDDKTDNRIENLAWGDASENALDSVVNGRHYEANKTHCKRGHEFTTNARGQRKCRECKNYLARRGRLLAKENAA